MNFTHTLGIDEAGRGCLAGPVVAAAVLLPAHYDLPGLDDSKKVTAKRRAALAVKIKKCALSWGLGLAWQGEVDKCNILQATFWAMGRALAVLRPLRLDDMGETLLLVDGNKTIPVPVLTACLKGKDVLPEQKAVVDGDALEPSISAASILAKTFRDRLMESLHKRFPEYGFSKHKGYGTKEHVAALRVHGPCPLHRLSFGKVLPPVMQGALL